TALEKDLTDPQNQSTGKQIQYLEDEIARLEKEDSKLYKAYMADVFDEHEYASKRKAIKERQTRLENELKRLKSTYRTREQFEAEKADLIEIVSRLRQAVPDFQPSFELKKKLIKKYVDVIRLDTNAQTFTIEGKLSSVPIVSTFAIAYGRNRNSQIEYCIEYSYAQNCTTNVLIFPRSVSGSNALHVASV